MHLNHCAILFCDRLLSSRHLRILLRTEMSNLIQEQSALNDERHCTDRNWGLSPIVTLGCSPADGRGKRPVRLARHDAEVRPIGKIAADVEPSTPLFEHIIKREALAEGISDLDAKPVTSSSIKIGDLRPPKIVVSRSH
jgi:hypothetical protein